MADLVTDRLVLRSWRDEDRAPFAAHNADPQVRRWYPGTLTREQSDATVDRLAAHDAAHGFTFWAVADRATGEFVGMVGLLTVSFEPPFTHRADPCVEIGWRLGVEWWGRGLATEAARAALDFGFTELALPEIVAFAVPGNRPSLAVMARIGMTHDPSGDFAHPEFPADSPFQRMVLYRARPVMGG